ncbi:MAG: hypothetical protein J5501_08795 [Ruminococcus sp.]|nr:hypothetical protein [Ruminococcus sp.]
MIQNNGINISRLAEAAAKQKDVLDELFTGLRNEHSEYQANNPLYRKYGFFNLVWTLLVLAGIVFAFLKRELLTEKLSDKLFEMNVPTGARDELEANLIWLGAALLVLIAVIRVTNLLRMIYSRRVSRRAAKIGSFRKTAEKRMAATDMADFRAAVVNAAEEGNRDFSADRKNDLGKKISAFRDSLANSNRHARLIKGIVSPVLSAFYYLFGFAVIWLLKDKFADDSYITYMWLVLFGIYTYFAIDAVICSIGGYLGKFMRPFGCLLAAGYAAFLWYIIRGIDGSFFDSAAFCTNDGTKLIPQLKISYVVILLQFIAMIVGIIKGDYLGMKDKWEHSFDLSMLYGGSGRMKTRGSVIRRMLWSLPWVLAAWAAGIYLSRALVLVSFVITWWRSMPLFKPFGSVIYEFFGRVKSISMSLMSFALMIMIILRVNGALSMKDLIMFGIALVVYLVFGLIIKAINDGTELFGFMNFFV